MARLGIDLQALRLSYQGKMIIDGLDLHFMVGTWNALLGKSGRGKTSILRFLAGLDHEGAMITGKVSPIISDDIAYMAQQDGLLPWLSVLDNALIALTLTGERSLADQEAARQLLAQVGLHQYCDCYPLQLSSGMRQRVALVRTLLQGCQTIVMDEPFSLLDAITRLEMQRASFDLLKGKTVILVTHDPFEALSLCDHIQTLIGEPVTKTAVITLPTTDAPRDITVPAIGEHYRRILAWL